jgi:hypothetical protein
MKPSVEKFSHGAQDGSYKEIIHVSPVKVEKIKQLLNAGTGYEINIEVSKN